MADNNTQTLFYPPVVHPLFGFYLPTPSSSQKTKSSTKSNDSTESETGSIKDAVDRLKNLYEGFSLIGSVFKEGFANAINTVKAKNPKRGKRTSTDRSTSRRANRSQNRGYQQSTSLATTPGYTINWNPPTGTETVIRPYPWESNDYELFVDDSWLEKAHNTNFYNGRTTYKNVPTFLAYLKDHPESVESKLLASNGYITLEGKDLDFQLILLLLRDQKIKGRISRREERRLGDIFTLLRALQTEGTPESKLFLLEAVNLYNTSFLPKNPSMPQLTLGENNLIETAKDTNGQPLRLITPNLDYLVSQPQRIDYTKDPNFIYKLVDFISRYGMYPWLNGRYLYYGPNIPPYIEMPLTGNDLLKVSIYNPNK